MHTKVSSDFWSKPEVIELAGDAKFAALWLLTNDRVNFAGYAEVSEKLFCFQTEKSTEDLARAFQGLPKTFMRFGKGYWIRNYIEYQIGRGKALAANNIARAVIKAMASCPAEVVEAVLREYPELSELWEAYWAAESMEKSGQMGVLPKPSPSPSEGLGKYKSRVEKSREAQSSTEQSSSGGKGAGEGGAGGVRRRRAAKPGFVLPAEHPEPVRSRLLAVAALKRRGEGTPWSPAEVEAFRAARLADLAEEDFAGQMEPMAAYYRAAIPREKDFRRRDLSTLLNHWSGELDRAREWARDNNDGLRRL